MKSFLTILVTMCLVSAGVSAYDIHKNKDSDPISIKGGVLTAYANADEAVITEPCYIYSITFKADTAGENVLVYEGDPSDGSPDATKLKFEMMEGLANNSKTVVFGAPLKVDVEVWVDVDAGDVVYFQYDLQ